MPSLPRTLLARWKDVPMALISLAPHVQKKNSDAQRQLSDTLQV
jgi:hypothetical protein